MGDIVTRLDRSPAAVPVAAVVFAAGLIANVWLLAGLPVVAVPLGVAEVVYGWRLRARFAEALRTLATAAMVVGAVIAVVAVVNAVGQPVGHFGTDHHRTSTVSTRSR